MSLVFFHPLATVTVTISESGDLTVAVDPPPVN